MLNVVAPGDALHDRHNRAHRGYLFNLIYDNSPARLGRGGRADCSHSRLIPVGLIDPPQAVLVCGKDSNDAVARSRRRRPRRVRTRRSGPFPPAADLVNVSAEIAHLSCCHRARVASANAFQIAGSCDVVTPLAAEIWQG